MAGLSMVRGAARVAVVMALVTPLRTAAAQTVLVSNVGQPTRDNTIVSLDLWAAQAFVTDGSSYLLSYVETLLGLSVGSPTIVSQLRADNGGLPTGALLTTFSFGSVTTGAPTLMTLTPGSAVALAPSTAYWLVFGVAGAGSFGWSYAEGNVTTGPGSLGSYSYSFDAGASWGSLGTDNPYKIAVNVTTPSTVPEPGTLSLIALGLVGAVAPFRRRFRRSSE